MVKQRKPKMRDLDKKPEDGKNQTPIWTRKRKAIVIFCFVGFSALAFYAMNNITNLAPPL